MPPRLVYLDNAATTPVRPEVLEAMLPYLGREAFGNPSSAHRFGRAARDGVEEARRTIAEVLGAEPGEVVFTSGGTEADNLAVIGSALVARERGGGGAPSASPCRPRSTRQCSRPPMRWRISAARRSSCRWTRRASWWRRRSRPRSPAAWRW